ncbi:MAG: hypothetical protein IJV64_12680, partial [Oscillospiraceae bacterium]|nr:hypothetical protein [Oscillospiraceae bacterium]
IKDLTKKDLLIFRFLAETAYTESMDLFSRIVPAVFFQPHFSNVIYELKIDDASGKTVLFSKEAEQIEQSNILTDFKYIKTFTPLRRFTSSYGGTLRFMQQIVDKKNTDDSSLGAIPDVISQRILNRSYMLDPEDRLYRDSVVVRFEDGKLNPKATFSRLAAFLDIPYTESMTYCSMGGERDPREFETNVVGFDSAPVYNSYDKYLNDDERYFIEYFLRDAYEFYGYSFQAYDGISIDIDRANELIDGFTTLNGLMREAFSKAFGIITGMEEDAQDQLRDGLVEDMMWKFNVNRHNIVQLLVRDLRFINRRGQPLQMTPLLEPDPALLDQPLYH